MRPQLSLAAATLILASLACNPLFTAPLGGLTTIPSATFSIDQAIPAGTSATEAALTLAPSTATLTIAGGADQLAQGEIHYNVAEWQPTVATDQGRLRIEQRLPEDMIASAPEAALNQWTLKLSDVVMKVQVACPAGDLTLDLADTLPAGVSITVTVGAANLRLVIPAEVAASVEVQRGPSSVATEGAWTTNGNHYTASGPGRQWAIKIELGVGSLTLARR